MRARKPWVRLRFRLLGWNVLFMTSAWCGTLLEGGESLGSARSAVNRHDEHAKTSFRIASQTRTSLLTNRLSL